MEVELAASFKDYFSKHAQDYAKYRPRYPEDLFKYLAEITPEHQAVWDCGTGNGQVALSLTSYFQQVYATDASESQIAQAFPHEKIQYQVARAEQTNLADRSVDLVTVGQALHWFNLEGFYQEVRRVVKPQGAIAIWAYGFFEIPTEEASLIQVLAEFYSLIEPFWPPERKLVEQKYQSISFPFNEEITPSFSMTTEWTVENLIGYLFTWSATQQFIEQNSFEEVAVLANQIKTAWGNSESTKVISWPIYIRVGRLE